MQPRSQALSGEIAAVINTIRDIKLASKGIDSRARTDDMPARGPELQEVERGVVREFPSAEQEKKALQRETVNFEVLPTYEESTETRTPVATSPIFTPATAGAAQEVALPQQPQRSNPQTIILGNLEAFRSSLLAYKQGASYAKRDAKRAGKIFFRDLYDQEMARRSGGRGHLECGERKQLKRELKPVKQMLKTAVWEAKRERSACC